MGRNVEQMPIIDQINADYRLLGLPVNMFIEEEVVRLCGLDICYLKKVPTFNGQFDYYAHFHIVHNGRILTIYYWQSRDCWFCKS